MSNIILPKVQILDTISDEAKILIEQDGEINRFAVANLGGGDISINLADTIYGDANPINADTLNGYTAKELFRPKAGFIYPLAGSVIPDGFLLCDGAEYGRTEFPELFAAIGTIYGSGNGSTTFNVPNLQTRVPVGAGEGYGLGAVGGEAEHTLITKEMPSHSHSQTVSGYTNWDSKELSGYVLDWNLLLNKAAISTSLANTVYADTNIQSNGSSQPHNNMQPYTVVNYIIATGKDTGVSVSDIVLGAQAIPLEVQYGGTGATNAADARQNLGINEEITDRVIYGKGKNLLENTANSQTINGVTFTVNDDGSVTANGTASNASSAYIAIPITLTIGEKYILSGCPAGGSNDSYQIYVTDTTFNSDFPDFGQGKTFTATYKECIVRVLISKGYTVNNLTFYPMIRLASETDDAYEPYYEGLKNLTDRGMKLLWENASPTSAFGKQTITLDLSGFSKLDIVCRIGTSTDVYATFSVYLNTGNMYLLVSSDNNGRTIERSCRQVNDGLYIEMGYLYNSYGVGTADNNYLIPCTICGIKGVSA